MAPGTPTPTSPAGSRRRLRIAIVLAVTLVVVVALTIVSATLTAPDNNNDSDSAPTTAPTPVIDDQEAREIAEVVTRSMFEISPVTVDTQIATFKDKTCGEFADAGLPNLISFTDEFKAQKRTSTVIFESIAVAPRDPAAPAAEVLVASSWQSGDTVNQSRIVYEVIMQNGKTCITKAQFL
ncbi:hypothetical protein [Williamsia sp.]|uniref:hypothetical protein n=1 Tax=Williamsia sp. TaxID=1872085 RepID=UPI002F93166E